MALLFEFCFYVGIVLVVVALLWLLRSLLGGDYRKLLKPLALLLLGAALIVGPAIVSRSMSVDLGPREKIVSNERHVSLTGWDGSSYDFLKDKRDAVVLQMGNQDVTDSTLDLLTDMSQLRELDLNDSKITDVGLQKLATLPALQTLRLRGTNISDAGFRQHLMTMPALKQLDLRQTTISPELVDEWKNATTGRRVFQ